MVDAAAARGLPVELLVQKALEGGAKGVPADRVIAAVRALAGELDASAGALHSAGLAAPDGDAIEAGAVALTAGAQEGEGRGAARAPRAPLRGPATPPPAGPPPPPGGPGPGTGPPGWRPLPA